MEAHPGTLDVFLLKLLSHKTTGSNGTSHMEYYRTRILGGLNRGMHLSMPALERLSYALGRYEPRMAKCMKRYIRPGDVVYDIGAHVGYFTLMMSRLVGEHGRVFAFEPNPANFALLKQNLKDNDIHNVTAVPLAVSDRSGEVIFATFGYSFVGHIANEDTPEDAQLIPVQATTLDDFVYRDNHPCPRFIKLDVEGAEDCVICGAENVLRQGMPIIHAEVRPGVIFECIQGFLTDHSYRVECIKGDLDPERDHMSDMLFVPNVTAYGMP